MTSPNKRIHIVCHCHPRMMTILKFDAHRPAPSDHLARQRGLESYCTPHPGEWAVNGNERTHRSRVLNSLWRTFLWYTNEYSGRPPTRSQSSSDYARGRTPYSGKRLNRIPSNRKRSNSFTNNIIDLIAGTLYICTNVLRNDHPSMPYRFVASSMIKLATDLVPLCQ
jgi:hypothetical protein